jgi:hypothetical protein
MQEALICIFDKLTKHSILFAFLRIRDLHGTGLLAQFYAINLAHIYGI